MKAITLPPPLAALVVLGLKKVDARGRWTHHRGPLAIHSGIALTVLHHEAALRRGIREHLLAAGWGDPEALPRGVVLGVVDLVDVCRIPVAEEAGLLTPWERSVGTYDPGRYVWWFKNAQRFRVGFTAGGLGGGHIWDWTPPPYFNPENMAPVN